MTEIEVYKAIAAITDEMSKEGISKSRQNEQQKYKYRGIDEVLNALSPTLAKNKLNILPRVTERECVERQSKNGGVLFYVTVKSEFDFVSAVDGSKHTVTTYGEAMDSADKATNKAMSAAYKYAAFQAFCIPTEGDNDADAHTHEIASKQDPKPDADDTKDKFIAVNKALKINLEKKDLKEFDKVWSDNTELFEKVRKVDQAAYDVIKKKYDARMSLESIDYGAILDDTIPF